MKTQYTRGFEAGVEYARTQVLEFLNAHHDLGDILTLEEVIIEIDHWETKDIETLRGLADGRLARHYSVVSDSDSCGADIAFRNSDPSAGRMSSKSLLHTRLSSMSNLIASNIMALRSSGDTLLTYCSIPRLGIDTRFLQLVMQRLVLLRCRHRSMRIRIDLEP